MMPQFCGSLQGFALFHIKVQYGVSYQYQYLRTYRLRYPKRHPLGKGENYMELCHLQKDRQQREANKEMTLIGYLLIIQKPRALRHLCTYVCTMARQ